MSSFQLRDGSGACQRMFKLEAWEVQRSWGGTGKYTCGRRTANLCTRKRFNGEIDLDACGPFCDTPASNRRPEMSCEPRRHLSYLPRRRSIPMRLYPELLSLSRPSSVQVTPWTCRPRVRPAAWQFLAVLLVCLLMTGCSIFRRSEPTTGRWWGGSPRTTSLNLPRQLQVETRRGTTQESPIPSPGSVLASRRSPGRLTIG